VETKDYIDAKVDAVRAQNDARFAEVLANVSVLSSKIDALPSPVSIWQIWGVALSTLGLAIAIAAFASDRFDGGISASAVVDQATSQITANQAKRDAAQDAKLDLILEKLDGMKPKAP
jgi:hypothetical protein